MHTMHPTRAEEIKYINNLYNSAAGEIVAGAKVLLYL